MEDEFTDEMKHLTEGVDEETKKLLLFANGIGYRRGYKAGKSHYVEFAPADH